jgi:cytoplasmic iron level regulating protein YaaA (DUF328/UPF0246 family)
MPAVSVKAASLRGIMMILSPAKTLDLSVWQPIGSSLVPTVADCSPSQTLEVAKAMKARKESELGKLLGISATLAKTTSEYWKQFSEVEDDRDVDERKPCIYSFSGAAYQGLQASECDESAMSYLQENLRIVDPLYGVLRPLDRMQPYRLEMATRNLFTDKKIKLANYWKDAVTQRLGQELEARPEPVLLNLASDEYSAAVDPEALPEGTKYIKVVFWEEGRVVSVHAKRARGLMARFLAENKSSDLKDVQKFAEEGYGFVDSKSDETTLVFDRRKGAGVKRDSAASNGVTGKAAKKPKRSKT